MNGESTTATPITPGINVPTRAKTRKTLIVLFIVLGILLGLGILLFIENLPPMPVPTISKGDADTNNETPAPTGGLGNSEVKETYLAPTGFSFNYPSTWKLYDGSKSSDEAIFIKYSLDREGGLILEKGNDFLYIDSVDTNPETLSSGIFTDETDKANFMATRSGFLIEGGTFYLSKSSTSIAEFNSPSNDSGIYSIISLSEFIENKTNGYDGHDDLIKNKSGKDYYFVKFSKTSDTETSDTNQSELVAMMQTIKW